MAQRKSDLSRSSLSGIQATDLQSTLTQERKILTNTLENISGVKENSITRFHGANTEVTYFLQEIKDGNDFLVNTSGMNDGDPNLVSYVKINHMILKMDAISVSWDESEGGGAKTPMYEGRAVVFPNTITPHVNDKFAMLYLERTVLFNINSVQPLSGDKDSAFELQFSLAIDYFTYERSELSKLVEGDYVLEQTHLTTSFRTIFKSDDYNKLQKIKLLYNEIGQIYLDEFVDNILNTPILKYINNLEESIIGDTINTLSGEGLEEHQIIFGKKDSRTKKFNNVYKDKELYDAELVEFLLKNEIFSNVNEIRFIPTQYINGKRESNYYKTIFYAIEKRDKNVLKSVGFFPASLDTASLDALPILAGKVNMIHCTKQCNNSLDLLPYKLCDKVIETSNDDVAPLDAYGSIFDKIAFLIALYINRFDKKLLDFLLYLEANIEDIRSFDSYILRNEAFYLFPLFGFVLKSIAEKFCSKQVVNEIGDPREYNS
jgi:hypothetical protein